MKHLMMSKIGTFSQLGVTVMSFPNWDFQPHVKSENLGTETANASGCVPRYGTRHVRGTCAAAVSACSRACGACSELREPCAAVGRPDSDDVARQLTASNCNMQYPTCNTWAQVRPDRRTVELDCGSDTQSFTFDCALEADGTQADVYAQRRSVSH